MEVQNAPRPVAGRVVAALAVAVLRIAAGQAASRPADVSCEILIVGGSLGGVAAAIGATGHDVHVVEDSDWIGGQVTSQGVSALDEHRTIETFGGTRSYSDFRRAVRSESGGAMNPGGGWVSRLCFEPRVGLKVLHGMVAKSGAKVMLESRVTAAEVVADRVTSVTVARKDGSTVRFVPRFVLDATDLGDLLPVAGVEHHVGTDARSDTNELHAAKVRDERRLQSCTYTFAVEFRKGESHVIEKPAGYERFRDTQPFTLAIGGIGESRPAYRFFEHAKGTNGPFWTYRRIAPNVAMINWPGNDYRGSSSLALDHDEAKRLSLSFLYWLQTECPRDDGGRGYPELLLRRDVMGTDDGLSKRPYIREGRRLAALRTIVESDLVTPTARGVQFEDSVGIGSYMIDLHSCSGDPPGEFGAGIPTKPFGIPLGALVPRRVKNVLAAGKCLGVTHVTNGAYRLHPVEWNVGESAGHTAAFCLEHGIDPGQLAANPARVRELQKRLVRAGIPIFWATDVPIGDPAFEVVQLACAWRAIPVDPGSLAFGATAERVEAARRACVEAEGASNR